MSRLDRWFEGMSRQSARRLSRRSWLSRRPSAVLLQLCPPVRNPETSLRRDGADLPQTMA